MCTKDYSPITAKHEAVDCHPVVLVLLVGVRTPQPQPGQHGAEEVREAHDDAERRATSHVA